MVPLCDMANHGMTPNAAYRLDPATNTFHITLTEVWSLLWGCHTHKYQLLCCDVDRCCLKSW